MAKHFFFYINNVFYFLPPVFPFESIEIQIWDKLIHCYLFYSITIEICSSLLEFIYLLIWYYRIIWKFQYCHFRSSHWRCSGKKSVLRNRCFQNGQVKFAVKTSEKKTMKEFILTKLYPVTLRKMEFFIGIFQGFWMQTLEHLFYRTTIFDWLLP